MRPRHSATDEGNALRDGMFPYRQFTLFGLVVVIWFAALAKGAHDLWAVTLLAAWLSLVFAIYLIGSCENKRPIFLPLLTPLLLMLFVFLLSGRYSYDMNTTHLELWIVFFSIVAFFLFLNGFREFAFRLKFLKYGGLSILPIALVAIVQYFNGAPLFISRWAATSTFTNSAVVAGFTLSWTIILWHFRRVQAHFSYLLGACLVSLFLARSWWAMVSLSIGFMYYYKEAIKMAFITRRISIIGLCFLVLLFMVAAFAFKIGPLHNHLYHTPDRIGWWLTGIKMALKHPWVGVGMGGYGTAFMLFRPHMAVNTLFVHNLPIQILSETGFPGLAAAGFLVMTYIHLLRRQKRITRESIAYKATLLTLAIFSLTSIFTDYFVGKLIVMMSVAFTLCEMDLNSTVVSKKTCFLVIIGFFLVAPAWYLPFKASQYHVEGLRFWDAGDLEPAELIFKKAIRRNPYQDESYSALAQISRIKYEKSHSAVDLAQALQWNEEAIRLKQVPTVRRENIQ